MGSVGDERANKNEECRRLLSEPSSPSFDPYLSLIPPPFSVMMLVTTVESTSGDESWDVFVNIILKQLLPIALQSFHCPSPRHAHTRARARHDDQTMRR